MRAAALPRERHMNDTYPSWLRAQTFPFAAPSPGKSTLTVVNAVRISDGRIFKTPSLIANASAAPSGGNSTVQRAAFAPRKSTSVETTFTSRTFSG